MMMVFRPPSLSVRGPLTRKEQPYTTAPMPKIMPKSALDMTSSPMAVLAAVRL